MRLKKFLVGLATASLVSVGMGAGLVSTASAAPTDPHPARVGVAGTGCYKTNAERGKVGVEWVAYNDFPSSTMTITASSNTAAFPVGTTVSGNAAKVSNVVNYVPGTYRLTLSFAWDDGATKGPTTGSVTVTKAQLTGDCDPIQYLADPTYTIEPATCAQGEVLRFGTVPEGAIWSPNSLKWDGFEGPQTRIAISAETTDKNILFTSSRNRYWNKIGIVLTDQLPKEDCTTAVVAPEVSVTDQQCTPGDGGKAVFTDGAITVPENEGYTVAISPNEVGASGEYTVRLVENTGYNLQAGNGFAKDGNDLVQTVTIKGAEDCTVPQPEATTKTISGKRVTCESGFETRTRVETTTYVWNAETKEFDARVLLPEWSEWTFARDLTATEKADLKCVTDVAPPVLSVIDQQCTPGDAGKAVFTDGTITVPENEGYTVSISPSEAAARADNARAISTIAVGAPGEYTVRLSENTGYNLKAGNGFVKDGDDLVQTVTIKSAADCTVPPVVKPPVVKPVTDVLASGTTQALKPKAVVVLGSTHKAAPRLAQTGANDLAWMAGAGFIVLILGGGAVVAARPKRSKN